MPLKSAVERFKGSIRFKLLKHIRKMFLKSVFDFLLTFSCQGGKKFTESIFPLSVWAAVGRIKGRKIRQGRKHIPITAPDQTGKGVTPLSEDPVGPDAVAHLADSHSTSAESGKEKAVS